MEGEGVVKVDYYFFAAGRTPVQFLFFGPGVVQEKTNLFHVGIIAFLYLPGVGFSHTVAEVGEVEVMLDDSSIDVGIACYDGGPNSVFRLMFREL